MLSGCPRSGDGVGLTSSGSTARHSGSDCYAESSSDQDQEDIRLGTLPGPSQPRRWNGSQHSPDSCPSRPTSGRPTRWPSAPSSAPCELQSSPRALLSKVGASRVQTPACRLSSTRSLVHLLLTPPSRARTPYGDPAAPSPLMIAQGAWLTHVFARLKRILQVCTLSIQPFRSSSRI